MYECIYAIHTYASFHILFTYMFQVQYFDHTGVLPISMFGFLFSNVSDEVTSWSELLLFL